MTNRVRLLQALAMNWRSVAVDLVGLAGVGAMLRGVAMVYTPAAWILGGLALSTAAFIWSKRA